jgi:hypothetical protein
MYSKAPYAPHLLFIPDCSIGAFWRCRLTMRMFSMWNSWMWAPSLWNSCCACPRLTPGFLLTAKSPRLTFVPWRSYTKISTKKIIRQMRMPAARTSSPGMCWELGYVRGSKGKDVPRMSSLPTPPLAIYLNRCNPPTRPINMCYPKVPISAIPLGRSPQSFIPFSHLWLHLAPSGSWLIRY